MAGKHACPDTFDGVVSDYVTGRARDLIAQAENGDLYDQHTAMQWIGAATEILKELTRNA